jgi:hypothetical protein
LLADIQKTNQVLRQYEIFINFHLPFPKQARLRQKMADFIQKIVEVV